MCKTSPKSKVQSSKLSFGVKGFFILFSFFFPVFSYAQCAMCRAALESEEGGVRAEAINDGIVYLMIIPYVLVAAAAYAIYRIKYAKKKDS